MRAVQRAIVGVGLALATATTAAVLIDTVRATDPQTAQSSDRADVRRSTAPAVPPQPIDAAEDTSVGTLPPPPAPASAARLAPVAPDAGDPAPPVGSEPKSRARPESGRTLGLRTSDAARGGGHRHQTDPGWTPGTPEHHWRWDRHDAERDAHDDRDVRGDRGRHDDDRDDRDSWGDRDGHHDRDSDRDWDDDHDGWRG